MSTILMLASYGLEIVECGGALAGHVQAGDDVYSAVLLSRPESRRTLIRAGKLIDATVPDYQDLDDLMEP